jgi:hypothetical protein
VADALRRLIGDNSFDRNDSDERSVEECGIEFIECASRETHQIPEHDRRNEEPNQGCPGLERPGPPPTPNATSAATPKMESGTKQGRSSAATNTNKIGADGPSPSSQFSSCGSRCAR